nr:C40 family peptidase [Sulfurovaceae bacterium]
AQKYLGKRYVWGATGPYRFDCSGFTSYVCKKNGVNIPRTSLKQSRVGKYVSRGNLRAGDLIFFDTSKRRRGFVNHVGIYIGNNKFIHASSAKKKVVVTSLNTPFYRSRFKWGRRM